MTTAENPTQHYDAHDTMTPRVDEHGHVHVHVVPPKVLLAVYFALVFATVLTVAVTYVDFGAMNVFIALGIAVIKAALVILYFMHLRWDNLFNGVILITALAFVATFLAITMIDSGQYKQNYRPPGTRQVMSSQNGL
ncbi:MAG TPA: cytochrome C oxidase subunit IV family protein [Tepidisphaeraceae bacterium]